MTAAAPKLSGPQGAKLCPFLPWVPVRNALAPQQTAMSPMACQEANCAIYDTDGKCCALRHIVNINLNSREISVK